MAISGALDVDLLDDSEKAKVVAEFITQKLNKNAIPGEDGWIGKFNNLEKKYLFEQNRRGVVSKFAIGENILESMEARKLEKMSTELQDAYYKGAELKYDEITYPILGPSGVSIGHIRP